MSKGSIIMVTEDCECEVQNGQGNGESYNSLLN